MYKVTSVKAPEGKTFSGYALELATRIKNGEDKDYNLDLLFRLTYPMMLAEVKRYTNLLPIDELETFISMAFMKTVDKFNPYAPNVSFMGYYRMVLKTEVVHGYYGSYRTTPELRDLKRRIDGTMESFETPVFDKHGVDTGCYHDLVEDKYGIDDELMNKAFIEDVLIAIDNVFSPKRKYMNAKRVEIPKKTFTEFVIGQLNGDKTTMTSISEKYGVSKSAVSNIVYKYKDDFRKELRKLGYNI